MSEEDECGEVSSSQVQDFLNGLTAQGGIGEYGSNEDAGPPQGVADTFAAPKVHDVEAQIPETVVCLEQREVGVVGVKLQVMYTQTDHQARRSWEKSRNKKGFVVACSPLFRTTGQ